MAPNDSKTAAPQGAKGSNPFLSAKITALKGCLAVKTAGHPIFPGFFALKKPAKRQSHFEGILSMFLAPLVFEFMQSILLRRVASKICL